jgi:hypothetical protein
VHLRLARETLSGGGLLCVRLIVADHRCDREVQIQRIFFENARRTVGCPLSGDSNLV